MYNFDVNFNFRTFKSIPLFPEPVWARVLIKYYCTQFQRSSPVSTTLGRKPLEFRPTQTTEKNEREFLLLRVLAIRDKYWAVVIVVSRPSVQNSEAFSGAHSNRKVVFWTKDSDTTPESLWESSGQKRVSANLTDFILFFCSRNNSN